MAAATESSCKTIIHPISSLVYPLHPRAIAVLHILDIVLVNYIHVRLGENLKR
jgi:hypothetical protein